MNGYSKEEVVGQSPKCFTARNNLQVSNEIRVAQNKEPFEKRKFLIGKKER
jgi:hypothetical protein